MWIVVYNGVLIFFSGNSIYFGTEEGLNLESTHPISYIFFIVSTGPFSATFMLFPEDKIINFLYVYHQGSISQILIKFCK